MATKRYIFSLSLLLVLIVGVGCNIFATVCACHHSTEHTTSLCGHHCSSHSSECLDQAPILEHKCNESAHSLSEYTFTNIQSEKSRNGVKVGFESAILGYLHQVTHTPIQLCQWLYSRHHQRLLTLYTPSSGSLRAPPSLN